MEGERDNSGAQIASPVTITLTRPNGVTGALTYTYATADGTARSTASGLDPADYTAKTGTVTIAAGATTATVTVNVLGDFRAEANETFTVVFTPATGTPGGALTSTVTIQDDGDVAQGGFFFTSTNAVEVDTGTSAVSITGTNVDNTSGSNAIYGLRIVEGAPSGVVAATAGSDFNAMSNAVTNGAAQNGSLQYSYNVVRGDVEVEPTETFAFALSREAGTAKLATTNQYVSIIDNDTAGTVSVAGTTVFEDNGNRYAEVTLTRTPGTTTNGQAPFAVNLSTGTATNLSAGQATATAGEDYTAITNQVVTFAQGVNEAKVRITISPDQIVEPDEVFAVSLSGATNGAVVSSTAGSANVVITNDDFTGVFSVGDVSVTEGDTGSQPGFFTVTRTAPVGGTLATASINFAVQSSGSSADSTATAGTDYSAQANGTLNFAVGQTSATVPFTVIGDTTVEQNETFRLLLSNVSGGGTIARGVGTATIVDNDRGTTPPPTPTPTPTPTPSNPGEQRGTDNNDVLISTNQGNSVLIGGKGDDTYLVYAQGDRVVEGVNEGNDILYTTVSYSLGENQVEAMSVADQMTTGAINLIGNYVSQIIVGNYGDNVLNGGSGGVDTLIGLFGNDTYAVGDARTVIVEQAGQGFDTAVTSVSYTLGAGVSVEVFAAQNAASTTGLRLGGNELAQTIAGTAGADTISGGGGRDVLLGGAGADTFVIGPVATGNVAVLADFVAGTDRIGLTSTAFNVGTSLDAGEFVAGTATTADQRVIYDAGTGQLFYDADGNGAGAAILFAQVVPGTALTAASFDVVVPTATTA